MSTAKSISVKPLSDRIIVERDEAEGLSTIIETPESSKEIPARGTIIAVGPGKRNSDGSFAEIDLKPGDKVLFAKYAGEEFEHDGEKLLMLREPDIMAVLDEA